MARIQIINGLEFTLEPLSDSLVEVVHQEQIGWFGVNLAGDADDYPFAWTTDADSCTQDGLEVAHPATGPAQALEDLAAQLASMQNVLDTEKANDPRNNLGSFLETLPQAEVKKETGWRNLVSDGLRGVNRSKDVLQERAAKAKDVLQERAVKGRDVLQERAAKGRDVLQERAAKGRDAVQQRAARGVEAVKEAASPSLACDREGHVFDDVRLVGSASDMPRFCRRCRSMINVGSENRGAGDGGDEGRKDDG